jgi:crotonobetainyl-CoA:carnitine CoA-transferase CaiB-like acyl-CoA transferase
MEQLEQQQDRMMRDLLSMVGLPETLGSGVRFSGPGDPLYDSPLYLAQGAAALHGAIGAAVCEIWRQRSGQSQTVDIDRLHAVQSLHRVTFLRQNGYPVEHTELFNATALSHRCVDGRFIEMSSSLHHLEQGVLQVLRCENTPAAVREACMGWTAAELEQALNRAGQCGTVHRSREEWRQHPQGIALGGIPAITIEKIGESDPVPFAEADRPLSGLRVLDHTHVLAGPMISSVLAEQGADVVRFNCNRLEEDITCHAIDTGFGKLAAWLDLARPDDLVRYVEMVKDGCDVVTEGYRPGSMDQRALGARRLAQIRPGLIYTSVSAYGHVGPWAMRKAFDNGAQASTGITFEHGSSDSPMYAPVQMLTDYGTGYLGALGTLAALIRRANEGGSYHVQVSLARTGMWFQDLGTVDRSHALDGQLMEELMATQKPTVVRDKVNESAILIETETPLGTLTHMAPVAQYSHTKSYWDRPVVPLGSSKLRWPERRPEGVAGGPRGVGNVIPLAP